MTWQLRIAALAVTAAGIWLLASAVGAWLDAATSVVITGTR